MSEKLSARARRIAFAIMLSLAAAQAQNAVPTTNASRRDRLTEAVEQPQPDPRLQPVDASSGALIDRSVHADVLEFSPGGFAFQSPAEGTRPLPSASPTGFTPSATRSRSWHGPADEVTQSPTSFAESPPAVSVTQPLIADPAIAAGEAETQSLNSSVLALRAHKAAQPAWRQRKASQHRPATQTSAQPITSAAWLGAGESKGRVEQALKDANPREPYRGGAGAKRSLRQNKRTFGYQNNGP